VLLTLYVRANRVGHRWCMISILRVAHVAS